MVSSVKFNYNQGHKIITPVCPVAIPVGLELSSYIPINLHKCLPCVLNGFWQRVVKLCLVHTSDITVWKEKLRCEQLQRWLQKEILRMKMILRLWKRLTGWEQWWEFNNNRNVISSLNAQWLSQLLKFILLKRLCSLSFVFVSAVYLFTSPTNYENKKDTKVEKVMARRP